MASGIPTRRMTRVGRATGPLDENALAQTAAARAAASKGPTSLAATKPTRSTSAAARDASSTTASKDAALTSTKVIGTKRRAAFGEVTNKNAAAAAAAAAAKGGSKPSTTMADKKASTTATTAVARAPRRTRASAAAEEAAALAAEQQPKEEGGDDAAAGATTTRLIKTRRAASAAPSASTTTTSSRATSSRRAATTTTTSSRVTRPTVSTAAKREAVLRDRNDDDGAPTTKRARTSSPVKMEREEQEEETEKVKMAEEQPATVEEVVVAAAEREPKVEIIDAGPAKDEGWEDLDAEDDDDPMMVNEYVKDIFIYMQKLELTTLPNPDYMEDQPEIQWKMRAILVDWLIEVHGKFRLLPETLFLAVNLVDRFLSARTISLVKLQLVGTTALFVAAKYEEVICPSVQNFLYMADGGYQDDEILAAERYLLQTIDFNLSYPNPIHFLRRISKADNYDIQTRTVAKYFMEISCVDHKMLHLKPSLIAAGAAWLARLVLDRGEWNANLVHYSDFSELELLPAAQLMLNYILRPVEKQADCFVKKYASKKYMKASTYVRDWAISRYREEGAPCAGATKGFELEYELKMVARDQEQGWRR